MKRNIWQHLFLIQTMVVCLSLGWLISTPAWASSISEPPSGNNSCEQAQDLGSIPSNSSYSSYLDVQPDIDYYRFNGTPGDQFNVQVNTTAEPYLFVRNLGWFGFVGGACKLIQGTGPVSYGSPSITVTVPADGVVILAVTGDPDPDYNGTHDNYGNYEIIGLTTRINVNEITGRVIDSDTHDGLPGNQSPFVSVALEQCFDYGSFGYCSYREAKQTDSQGDFRFQGNYDGNFRVQVTADQFLYEQPIFSPTGPTGYESISITGGRNHDFGDIPLVPIIPVESISGKVKDKITGRPLAGTVDPFARVQLYRSGQFGFEYMGETPTNKKGDYLFSSAVVGHPLPRGNYRVVGYADQYQEINNTIDLLNVQAHEARVAPVLKLLSNPVRITDVKPCDAIPAQGGICDFSYEVTNGTANRMKGAAWSLVKAWGTGGFVNGTNFLACEQPLILTPGTRGASQVMRCQFTVPARVPENAYFCLDARFGEGSLANLYFTVQGVIDPLFCLTKLPGQGNFQVLPQEAAIELMRHKWHKGDHR